MKSDFLSWKRWCFCVAVCGFSVGYSRMSGRDSAEVMVIISFMQLWFCASRIIFPRRRSMGSFVSFFPVGVIFRVLLGVFCIASSSVSSCMPLFMLRVSGFSRKGKFSMFPRFSAVICSITVARFVRRISGSVNSLRCWKFSSEYSRMQIPFEVRPQRPDLCLALACDICSMGSRCIFVRLL